MSGLRKFDGESGGMGAQPMFHIAQQKTRFEVSSVCLSEVSIALVVDGEEHNCRQERGGIEQVAKFSRQMGRTSPCEERQDTHNSELHRQTGKHASHNIPHAFHPSRMVGRVRLVGNDRPDASNAVFFCGNTTAVSVSLTLRGGAR